MGDPTGDSALAEQIVDAIHDLGGRHSGFRAVHAKGLVCAGTFTATPAAAALTRAQHMQGEPVRATVRFSNGGGDPKTRDGAKDGRGLAAKLYLEDGSRTDMVAITLPQFFVRTPEDFLAFTRARKPDPDTGQPDMARLGEFLEAHPEALPAIQHALSQPPPASYAQLEYHGIHAFRWIAADGSERWVRFSFRPAAGVAGLSEEEARELGADYLQEELPARLAEGPVEFDLEVAIAQEGDDPDDPTQAWPDDRERATVGRLSIEGLDTEREQDGDVLVFDPTRVTDGIELSGDAILRVRPDAYAVSVERRSGARRQ
ncbi:MAG TPA: catalase family peroxidase [Thermoleophilaceae bacterium]|nr:catalase family peroxidase [Thermoleophilaceae bacterium]